MELIKYNAARKALQEARNIDEVKEIRNKAEALRIYAKQAADVDMQNWAAEIRVRAERRAGELLGDMQSSGEMPAKEQGRPTKVSLATTLPKLGITRDQSSKWQKLAAVPEEEFENTLRNIKGSGDELTTGLLLRKLRPASETDLNVLDELWKKLNCMLPSVEDGNEHVLISLLESAVQSKIETSDDQQTAELIVSALRTIPQNFVGYADRIEANMQVAWIA